MLRLLSAKTLHFNYSLLSSSKISHHYVQPVREIRNFSAQVGSSHQNSALSKDVIVFKYDNPRFFKMMNFFAISQVLFWGYLAHWTFYGLKDVKQIKPVNEESNNELSWWKKINLGESKYKNSIAALCLFFGKCILDRPVIG